MGNGEWGMGNGEWGMGNGEWGMGNGEWGMGHGEWGMGNGEEVSNALFDRDIMFQLKIIYLSLIVCSEKLSYADFDSNPTYQE